MMLEPLLQATLAIQIHVAAVVPAAVLGPYVLSGRKGTPLHRLLGRIWVLLMAISALSSFFIHELDVFHGFSPIHLLSIFVLVSLWRAVCAARAGNIRAHKAIVLSTYIGGIVIAGGFTLMPYRIMNTVVLGGGHGWILLLMLVALAALPVVPRLICWRRRPDGVPGN